MSARNVIISLVVVLGIFIFLFIRSCLEPRKKLTFNRNPSRIEYSAFALCRMECYSINANSITSIFRNGKVLNRTRKQTCYVYKINTFTKDGRDIYISVEQCGTVAKVTDCYIENRELPCKCVDNENKPLSYSKSIHR
jgi:hypothetical protein